MYRGIPGYTSTGERQNTESERDRQKKLRNDLMWYAIEGVAMVLYETLVFGRGVGPVLVLVAAGMLLFCETAHTFVDNEGDTWRAINWPVIIWIVVLGVFGLAFSLMAVFNFWWKARWVLYPELGILWLSSPLTGLVKLTGVWLLVRMIAIVVPFFVWLFPTLVVYSRFVDEIARPNFRNIATRPIDATGIELPSVGRARIRHEKPKPVIQRIVEVRKVKDKNGDVLEDSPIRKTGDTETFAAIPFDLGPTLLMEKLAHALNEGKNFSQSTGDLCGWANPKWRRFCIWMVEEGFAVKKTSQLYVLTPDGAEFMSAYGYEAETT